MRSEIWSYFKKGKAGSHCDGQRRQVFLAEDTNGEAEAR